MLHLLDYQRCQVILAFTQVDSALGAVQPSLIFQLLVTRDAGQMTIETRGQSRGELVFFS